MPETTLEIIEVLHELVIDEDPNSTTHVIEEVLEILEVGVQGPSGPPGTGFVINLILEEIPTGDINGVNATFTTEFEFIPEQINVFLNGVMQRIVEDYITVGTQTIQLNTSPLAGEVVSVNYIRS